jgi:hypothetical protein
MYMKNKRRREAVIQPWHSNLYELTLEVAVADQQVTLVIPHQLLSCSHERLECRPAPLIPTPQGCSAEGFIRTSHFETSVVSPTIVPVRKLKLSKLAIFDHTYNC